MGKGVIGTHALTVGGRVCAVTGEVDDRLLQRPSEQFAAHITDAAGAAGVRGGWPRTDRTHYIIENRRNLYLVRHVSHLAII